jgi:hypothetical protein
MTGSFYCVGMRGCVAGIRGDSPLPHPLGMDSLCMPACTEEAGRNGPPVLSLVAFGFVGMLTF